MKGKKILVVEDQSGPLENISLAIREAIFKENLEKRFTDTPEEDLKERGVDVARCYDEALEAVGDKEYDLVFLDHRLPYENQTELEASDFDEFCKCLDNIGYGLIPTIKDRSKKTVVIGTSSCDAYELRRFGQPDYVLKKIDWDISEKLEGILEDIERRKEDDI